MCLMNSLELLYQIGRHCCIFLALNAPWLRCLLVSKVGLIKKLEERTCLITLVNELNVLYFFEFLIRFLTKMSDYWPNLLLLRSSSLEWLVTVQKIFFRTVIQWWMRKNESLLKFYGWLVFCAIEQVSRRAFCVF